ncbi:hypothetical protein CIW54_14445 [Paraburkholderia sp. T12-10]|jgi:hypothetical protein|nr:hypothetical protein CIW54_14445 [Paraburkholderia sp. T12-10]
MEQPLVYLTGNEMILPRLFPREARGATFVAKHLTLDVGRWAPTRAAAWRAPRKRPLVVGATA